MSGSVRAGSARANSIQQHDISVDGLRIRVLESGPRQAQTLLLLHGFMASAQTYRKLQAQLSDRFHVVSYDAPGHGNSARSLRRLSGRYLALVAHRLLEELSLNDVIVVGQSMGGLTAIQLAARWPERIQKIVVINPAGFSVDPLRHLGMQFLFEPNVYSSGPDLAFWIAARGSTINFGEEARRDLQEQKRLRTERRVCQAWASAYRTIASGELDAVAPLVKRPVVMVIGEKDTAFPPSYRENAAALLPQVQLVHIEQAGHNVHHDAPEQLAAVLDRIARKHTVPTATD